jgi:hypothetical protein
VAHPQIAVFARLANGDARPTRAIAGQHSLITRTVHDMSYNALRDEIVIPQFYAQAIMTYRGGANGDEAPIRVISGSKTGITNPARLGLDAVHKEVFVPLEDEILVFPSEAEGNIAPIRIIKGPDTLLGADALAIDPVHDLLIVSGTRPRQRGEGGGGGGGDGEEGGAGGGRGAGQILIFNRTDNGNVKPRSVIFGPKTQIGRTGLIAVYPPTRFILLGVPSYEKSAPNNFVGVWSENDNGDVPPRWTIGGPNQLLRQVRGITLVPKDKSVVISDKYVNAVMTYYFPEIF